MQDPTFVRRLFSQISGRYDCANHVLSAGVDFLWRERVARQVAGWKPKTVLDLATGSGDLLRVIQRHCPEALAVGADFCFPMLKEAARKNIRPVVLGDGTQLPFRDDGFSVVTVAFGLRNMSDWGIALREMHRVLHPGGHLLVLDFSLPAQPALRAAYRWYLHRVLPSFAAAITGNRDAYAYLGDSIERFPRGEAMQRLFEGAGFVDTSCKPLSLGIASIYTGRRG